MSAVPWAPPLVPALATGLWHDLHASLLLTSCGGCRHVLVVETSQGLRPVTESELQQLQQLPSPTRSSARAGQAPDASLAPGSQGHGLAKLDEEAVVQQAAAAEAAAPGHEQQHGSRAAEEKKQAAR